MEGVEWVPSVLVQSVLARSGGVDEEDEARESYLI